MDSHYWTHLAIESIKSIEQSGTGCLFVFCSTAVWTRAIRGWPISQSFEIHTRPAPYLKYHAVSDTRYAFRATGALQMVQTALRALASRGTDYFFSFGLFLPVVLDTVMRPDDLNGV